MIHTEIFQVFAVLFPFALMGFFWWLFTDLKRSAIKRGILAALCAWGIIGVVALANPDLNNRFAVWLYAVLGNCPG